MTHGSDTGGATALSRAMETIRTLRERLAEHSTHTPLAVVGMGLRAPGGITDPGSYWDALASGKDLTGPLPESRRGPFGAAWEDHPTEGGYLDRVLDFDAGFFGMENSQAAATDPQHRLLLEVAWESLEDAALPPGRIDGSRTGLFLGVTGDEYRQWQPTDPGVEWGWGNGHCFSVGRLAYAMGLNGAAVAVDTACSSSLVAVHLARQALERGECDIALAGGVNLALSPHTIRMHQLSGGLSPDGVCRSFDARANGYVRGEGCGVVVLKRWDDALRDHDRVHAVIRGSAVNQSGRSTGFGAPNVLSQHALINAALTDAGLSPADIGMVEAHGTGTPMGDAVEMEAIVSALGRRNGGARLPVGSVKANLGHSEAAAGIMSLLKAILCVRHRQIPPLAHFTNPNPLFDLEGTGVFLPEAHTPWPSEEGEHASVSAFGMGGTNAHVLVGPTESPPTPEQGAVPGFELSARTPTALRELAHRLHSHIKKEKDEQYPAFAYTTTYGRARHRWRARLWAPDRRSALETLRSLELGEPHPSIDLHEGASRSSVEDVLPLSRRVADLPAYPWQREHHAPRGEARLAEDEDPEPTKTHASARTDRVRPHRWEWRTVPEARKEPSSTLAGHWLLLCLERSTAEKLTAELREGGIFCTTVLPGDRTRRVDDTTYEIDTTDPEHHSWLSANLGGTVDGVLHAQALDEHPVGPAWADSVEPADTSVLSASALLRALEDVTGPPRHGCVLLTRGAQRVGTEEAPHALRHAPLWGRAHPGRDSVRVTAVDLDPRHDGTEHLLLALSHAGQHHGLVLRDGVVLTRTPVPFSPEPRPAWEHTRLPKGSVFRVAAERPGILSSITPVLAEAFAPGPEEVEIEVWATGLNFSDVLKAMGAYPGSVGRPPLGIECAGRVLSVGRGVDHVRVGDSVMVVAPAALASRVTTPAHLVVPLPSKVDLEHGAALPIAFLTALYGLGHLARVAPGEHVLVHSATGGVGLAALQVARARGAEVLATAGSPAKRELLRSLGVRHVMDSRSLDFVAETLAATGGRGVDVVLNSLSGTALESSMGLLAPGGRFVEIGKRDVHEDKAVGLGSLRHDRSVFAVDLEEVLWDEPETVGALYDTLLKGFEEDLFDALPITVHTCSDLVTPFVDMAEAAHTGKFVVRTTGVSSVAIAPAEFTVRGDASYLITGGPDERVWSLAHHLAAHGARHLAVTRRAAPGREVGNQVAALRANGAHVTVLDSDTTTPEGTSAVLAAVDTPSAPLAGVVCLTAVPSSEEVTDPLDSVEGLMGGARNLCEAVENCGLDFLVLSAVPPSSSSGKGHVPMVEAALEALGASRGEAHRHTLGIDAESLPHLMNLVPDEPGYTRVTSRGGDGALPVSEEDPPSSVHADLRCAAPSERLILLERHCVRTAALTLGVSPEEIRADSPLAELGFDSRRTLEFRARLADSLAVDLPPTIGWRFPTLEALVPHLAELMELDTEAAPDTLRATAPEQGREPTETPEIDALSDDEVTELLLERIDQLDERLQG